MSTETELPKTRVSILARILPAIAWCMVMLGAAFSARLVSGVLEGMRDAESAGIAAVASGIAQANLAILISLCVAVFLATISLLVAVIRIFTPTKTASPSVIFYIVMGVLAVIPLGLAWEADSLLIGTLASRGNISVIAPNIQTCVLLTTITAALFSLILIAGSFVPLPSFFRARLKWTPMVMLVLMEIILIALAIGFQVHMSWLRQVWARESF